LFNEMIAEEFQDHLLNGPGDNLSRGPDVMHQLYTFLRKAFPDIYFDVNDVMAENDKVMVRWSFSGTHKGDLVNIAPTGQAIDVEGIAIYKLFDGKIVERWVSTNLDLLIQKLS
jgi:predicted ester cyclase